MAAGGGRARAGSAVDRDRLRGAGRVSDRRWARLLSRATGHDARAAGAATRRRPISRGTCKASSSARDELDRRWRSDRPLALVSDPQQRRDTPAGSFRRRSTFSAVLVIDGYSRTFAPRRTDRERAARGVAGLATTRCGRMPSTTTRTPPAERRRRRPCRPTSRSPLDRAAREGRLVEWRDKIWSFSDSSRSPRSSSIRTRATRTASWACGSSWTRRTRSST